MAVLVDTNVLIFCIQREHPWHEASIRAVEHLLTINQAVVVLPQNIAEFWNVCTRPAGRNGLGLTPIQTEVKLKGLESMLTILHETPAVYARWRILIVQHGVSGVQAHDARIAAAMQVHAVSRLLTYNPRDFGRYAGIHAVRPEDFLLSQ